MLALWKNRDLNKSELRRNSNRGSAVAFTLFSILRKYYKQRITSSFSAIAGIVALCTIAVIAVDRAIVVGKPMGTLTFTTRKAMIGVAASWIWSLVWNTPPLFGWGGYQMEGVMTSCAPDWYNSDPINVSYIVCYFLKTYCFLHLLSHHLVLYIVFSSTTKAETQVAWMVIVMVMAFLICWLPYATFALVVVGNPEIYINPIIATVPMYMAKTSTFYNPIIYIFMNKQVMAAFPCL
uniref:G-protein coupled receptors family 1 profile domain-containing protein n=1 Tax=Varanus komodoensis TaxID=61221 RepID=A0A8D2Q1K6_VARKO